MTLQQYALNTIYDAVRTRLITWDSIQTKQRELYPHCKAHDAPAPCEIDGMYLCEQCMLDHREYIITRTRGAR